MDFAAGDSCFYIGLGNTKANTPSFEPYQCCPKPQSPPEKEKTETKKNKTGKPIRKETKEEELKTNGKPDNNHKKKEKRNKKDNGKASWWWWKCCKNQCLK